MKIIRKILAAVAAGAVVACTFTIDEEELQGPCPEDTKRCEVESGVEACVSTQDPAFGCNREGCQPCTLDGATAICGPANGLCTKGACLGTNRDCDGNGLNGCEIDIDNDPAHCGQCNSACPLAMNASEMNCGNTNCFVRICNAPWGDCNFDVDDGCEINLDEDPNHCGGCGDACEGGQTCVDGECT